MRIFVFILIGFSFFACDNFNRPKHKIDYRKLRLATEGSWKNVLIDSITPLPDLVKKLNDSNKLIETGKAYWIGYNDLMYSIAVYSDDAIEPLINLIDTTSSKDAQIAAIYTLHLIGINCTTKGRTYEEFENSKARDALLSLLHVDSLQYQIVKLLIRDPWLSDVPILIDIMKQSKGDCWTINNGLTLYNLPNQPINQLIPEEIGRLNVTIKKTKKPYTTKEYNKLMLSKFRDKYKSQIEIEDTLLNFDFIFKILQCYKDTDLTINNKVITAMCYEDCYKQNCTKSIYELLHLSHSDYCFIGNNLNYYLANNKLYICSPQTAKDMWIKWSLTLDKRFVDTLKMNKSYKKITATNNGS